MVNFTSDEAYLLGDICVAESHLDGCGGHGQRSNGEVEFKITGTEYSAVGLRTDNPPTFRDELTSAL